MHARDPHTQLQRQQRIHIASSRQGTLRLWCLLHICVVFVQMSPDINHMLHLSVFPNDEFRQTTIFLVCMSIAGTFLWDRVVLLLFGPPPHV